jgi:16S rRNA processing protein RimM
MSAEDHERGFVLLARLVRTQGRHGEILADILTDFPERFAGRTHVWLVPPDAKAPAREVEIERHWLHKGRIVLKLAAIDSISDAEAYRGWHIAIPREARVPLESDTVYIADLIGCHVIDETTGAADLGPVLDVERGEGGAADLLVLNHNDEELLIPFAKAYLVAVDLDARILRMRLPQGLTKINAPMTEDERSSQRQSEDGGAEAGDSKVGDEDAL